MRPWRSLLPSVGSDFFDVPRWITLWFSMSVLLYAMAAIATGLLYTSVPGTAWTSSLLAQSTKYGLLAQEFVYLFPPVACLALLLAALERVREREGDRGLVARLALAGQLGLGLVVSLAIVSTWSTFRVTGVFLDPFGMKFWLADPWQVVQHMTHLDPYSAVISPLLVLVIGLAVGIAAPRLSRRVPAVPSIVALGLIVVGVWNLDPWIERGRRAAISEVYQAMRVDRTGPLTHLGEYWRIRDADPMPPASAPTTARVTREPIEHPSTYTHNVTPGDLRPYDVIVLLVESLRLDQLRYGGSTRDVMPTVDKIAEEGRAFTFHYTQASHSNYADMPPLSSHYPLRGPDYHIYPEDPPYPRDLIYDILKRLGWKTAVFSSQNENWGGMINYLRTGSIDHFFHAESFGGDTYLPRRDSGFEKFVKGTKRAGKVDDRHTVSAAIDWIDKLGDEPYFMYMNLQNSHVPYEIPADFLAPFGTGKVSFPLRFGSFPRDSVGVVKDLYSSSLAYVDAQLERLVNHLEETGRWDRTVLVITGDTGQAFYEHGFAAHASELYDEVMRVPLVIRGPGVVPRIDDDPAQHVDIPPTLLKILGLPEHPSFQGRSLLRPRADSRALFLVAQTALAHQYAIVQDRYKLIWDARLQRYRLYDLLIDPAESVDLSDREVERRRAMARRLRRWVEEQYDYYGDWRRQTREYPPRIAAHEDVRDETGQARRARSDRSRSALR